MVIFFDQIPSGFMLAGQLDLRQLPFFNARLTNAEIQFLNLVGDVNEQSGSIVQLEASYGLESCRQSKNFYIRVCMMLSEEGYNLVFVNDETVPRFSSLDHDDAYWQACSLIDGRD